MYNYADDNTLSYSNKILQTIKVVLENESTKVIGWFTDNKMQANPDKVQAIMLGKLGFENCKSLNICGSTIQCEETVKLLGVTFDYMLNFGARIANICKKAARQINVLLGLSNVLKQETKILIYKSFIYSNFNYCPLVWHFCSKASTDKLEKLQYRALRLVFNDFTSSHDDLLTKWGARWLSGRVSDSGARGPGFETYRRRVVSLSKTLYSPKVLVYYPGSDGSVPI